MARATSKGENDRKYNSSGKQGARSLRELKVERRLGFPFERNGKEKKVVSRAMTQSDHLVLVLIRVKLFGGCVE